MTDAQIEQRDRRLAESDRKSAAMGLPPLDRRRMVHGCTFERWCSPYMEQSWAHDVECPRGAR